MFFFSFQLPTSWTCHYWQCQHSQNEELKSLILKGPKSREPWSFKWQQNLILLWILLKIKQDGGQNPNKKELDCFSEWVKSIRAILKSHIKHVRSKMRTSYPSALNKPEVMKTLNT
jgi:hypothetical protein